MAWRQDEPEYVVEQDDEAWRDEDESLRAIEFVPPVYQPRGGYSTNIQGTRGGTVNTPVGPAQIQLEEPREHRGISHGAVEGRSGHQEGGVRDSRGRREV